MSSKLQSLIQAGNFSFQIVQRGLMTQAEYDEVSDKALRLFEFGQVCWLHMLLKNVSLVLLVKH